MARRQAPLQINEFTGGLNTEFNPLSMPPNISLDELNMEIATDGSRRRRLGFSLEPASEEVDTNVVFNSPNTFFTTMFRWDNAGGDPQKSLLVAQVGNYLGVHDMDQGDSISSSLIYSEVFSSGNYDGLFSYAVVDGLLVVVNSQKPVLVYEYDGTSITKTEDTLYIRDLFGVDSGELTQQNNLSKRPTTLTNTHRYNLRNQTFYSPRFRNELTVASDPIEAFNLDHPDNKFPSNADDLNRFLLADANVASNRTIERFFSRDMVESSPAVGESPKGHFIIDALDRGASRQAEEVKLRQEYSELIYPVGANSLPVDRTPGGASVIESFAGRFWYAGFSGNLIGGDPKSPRMSSYLLFSMLVKDKTDITQCYQRADPTSNEDSAIVDTDGGFIRLDGAYGISKMIDLEGSLFVFARNGVWRVSGGENDSFSATNFLTQKLSTEGSVAPNAVVVVSNQIFYWSEKGIFNIARNEFGFWEVEDITKGKIETFYLNIPERSKQLSTGSYDVFSRKIRWVYTEPTVSTSYSNELVLDLNYGAFTPNRIETLGEGLPIVVNLAARQSFVLDSSQNIVTVNGDQVTENGVFVTTDATIIQNALRQSIYLVITGFSPTIHYSFGYYRDTTFVDWLSVNYDSYLVSGSLTGGEARFKKQTPYLNVFLKRTENGFDENLNPLNQSSCLISSQWNWTNSRNANKWSTPREAYRYSRSYFPVDSNDTFDTGDTVIVTRNKIRGSGHSVSFRFTSSPGKDMHVHGWSFDLLAGAKE